MVWKICDHWICYVDGLQLVQNFLLNKNFIQLLHCISLRSDACGFQVWIWTCENKTGVMMNHISWKESSQAWLLWLVLLCYTFLCWCFFVEAQIANISQLCATAMWCHKIGFSVRVFWLEIRLEVTQFWEVVFAIYLQLHLVVQFLATTAARLWENIVLWYHSGRAEACFGLGGVSRLPLVEHTEGIRCQNEVF